MIPNNVHKPLYLYKEKCDERVVYSLYIGAHEVYEEGNLHWTNLHKTPLSRTT